MSVENLIILNRDNPLVMDITFNTNQVNFSLNDFTEIEVIFGAETYTLSGDPDVIVINSDTQLQLHLGGTSEEYASYLVITGFHPDYPNGYVITSKCKGNLEIPRMC